MQGKQANKKANGEDFFFLKGFVEVLLGPVELRFVDVDFVEPDAIGFELTGFELDVEAIGRAAAGMSPEDGEA